MQQLGETIDQLTTLDIGRRRIINHLYEAAYDHHDGSPTMLAAQRLHETVSPDDEVLIVTGMLVPPTYTQETDGPPGAASLARAIKIGLGAHPTILCEEEALPMVRAAARAYGLNVTDGLETREAAMDVSEHPSAEWTCTVESFTKDSAHANQEAVDVLDTTDPAAVLAVERVGPNEFGEYHGAGGENLTETCAKIDPLFEETDALTVGIGDGGNEIGFGTILDDVRRIVKYTEECGCGCGGGVATKTETDVIIPAAVSNWGAHGIATALSMLLDEPVLHRAELEERALVQCGLAGGIGPSRTDGVCDSIPAEQHASVVTLLHQLLEPGYAEERGDRLKLDD